MEARLVFIKSPALSNKIPDPVLVAPRKATVRPAKTSQVKVDVRYSCGCKFHTTNLPEAILHSETTGHGMTALGTIK